MKITLLTMGRTDVQWVRDGLDIYVSRLAHYVNFSLVEIPQLKKVSSLSKDQIKLKEGESLLSYIRPSDEVVLLDERGAAYSSIEFSTLLRKKLNAGRDLTFVIGGSYGFSEALYGRADWKISLSPMTFSHQMVRVIFAEQLYRAFTIINGEPYHHE